MARPIDEKIVAMKLDNSDFVKRAAETTGLFGKLRDALNKVPGVNLGKTTKEIGAIGREVDGIKMNRLTEAVQTVASRFTTLGIVAVTALQNITNRAIDAGIALAKNLSVDQVMAGFQEYELKIGSIRTILANTAHAGSGLDDVNKSLNELNAYADLTIYNFAQMTENIGRFTAAGVGLEDSTIAIKGMSNMAATSGATVHQLNSAMYQMSQALAAGTFNLMDWNSLVNSGMGGKMMQDSLVETARGLKKNVDLSEGFRNSISDGWLTAEVFLETMKKFGEDETMIEAATKVRTFTQLMDTLQEAIGSGWAATFEHVFGDFEEATELWSGLGDAITGWVDKTSDARNAFIGGIADGGGFLNIFTGIQNAAKPVIQIFQALGDGFKRVFPPASVKQVIGMTESFKEFTAGLTLSEKTTGKITTIFQGLFAMLSSGITIVKQVGSALLNLIPEGTGTSILDLLVKLANMSIRFNEVIKSGEGFNFSSKGLLGTLKALGLKIKEVADKVIELGSALMDKVGPAIEWIKTKLEPVGRFFKEAFGGFGGEEALGGGFLVALFMLANNLSGALSKLTGGLSGALSGIGDTFKGMFGSLGDALESFQEKIKYDNLLKIAIALGILAVSIKLLQGMSIVEIAQGLGALAASLGIMSGGLMLLEKMDVTGGIRMSVSLIALATSVAIMAVALKKISDLNPQELIAGISGLVGATGALAAGMIAISKWGGKIGASSIQLIALAGAVYILAGAIDKMSSIKSDDIVRSTAALGIIFVELAIFLKIADRSKLGAGSAVGLLAVSAAIHVMVSAIKKIADIDTASLTQGLSVIGIILLEIAMFSKVVSGGTLLAAGAGLILVATAITALIKPITTFSKMSWTELAKGMAAMAASLLIMAGGAMLMSGTIAGVASLTLMAVALNMLVIPIKQFASMSWGELIKGFVAAAGGIALLAGVSMLLTPAIVPMLGFAAAILAMGVAMVAVGAGVALFSVGLVTLASLSATSIAAIISALGLLIKGLGSLIVYVVDFVVQLGAALIDGLALLAPKLIDLLANLFNQLISKAEETIPRMLALVETIVTAILGTLESLIPKIVETVFKIVTKLLEAVATYYPKFLELGVQIVVNMINGIADSIYPLVNAGTNLIITFIESLAKNIRENGPKFTNAIMELLGEVLILFVKAGIQVVNALFGWMPGVKKATAAIGENAEATIRANFGAADAGKDKGGEFADALDGTSKDAKDAGKSIANAGKDGAGSIDMKSTGADFGSGFASGISGKLYAVTTAAKSLAQAAASKVRSWLDMHSPSRVAKKDGGFFGEGLALGIIDKTKRVGDSAKRLALTAKDSLHQFLEGFDPSPEDNELHFKAVVDYEQLDVSGFGQIKPLTITPDTTYTNSLATSADQLQRQTRFEDGYKRDIKPVTEPEQTPKQPAVIQVVTPDKRQVAKWLVSDITEFQEFELARVGQF